MNRLFSFSLSRIYLHMKRLLFSLIILTSLSNIAFASFPVSENQKIEVIDDKRLLVEPYTTSTEKPWVYAIFSLLSALLGYFMLIITFASAYGGSSEATVYLLLTFISMLAAIVLGLIGLAKKSWGSIVGFLLGLLGFLMIVGSK